MKKLSMLLLALACVPWRASDVSACALAIRPNSTVHIQGEEALIVYDARTRTEHFIRTAAFEGADADFGFLVPTPTVPTLTEVDADVFARLFELYKRPEPVVQSNARSRTVLRSARAAVEVIEQVTVAGLDASVLRATDADALNAWLAANHYPSSQPLRDWFARYVRDGWVVTAFKIDPGAQRGRGFSTRAVRMSFTTDRPFFPYSEPVGPPSPRPFRVSVVADGPMRVATGTAGWNGRLAYRARPGRRLVEALRGVAPEGSLGRDPTLSVFDEPRSVRGRDDLFFEQDPRGPDIEPYLTTRITAH
jgi:hypothetical protein